MCLGKKVVDVSVGVVHVMVLLESGEVYTWGKKEYAHSAEAMPPTEEPSPVLPLANTQIIGIAAGPTQVIIKEEFEWSIIKIYLD
jgi:hypothetical protein